MSSSSQKRLLLNLGILQGFWAFVLVASLAFNVDSAYKETLTSADAAANATISRDMSIRGWAAIKGGVYVFPSDETPPNPYLAHPQSDLVTLDGLHLTLLNPAYLLREIQQNSPNEYGIKTRLVSRNPLNPVNLADSWEAAALKKFQQQLRPISEVTQIEGEGYLRKIHPFVVDDSCMACHAHQGYQLGEIRGGISASIPMKSYQSRYEQRKKELYITHLGVWALGFFGLSAGYLRERKSIHLRSQYQHQLKLAAEVFEHSYEGIMITDASGSILDVNNAFERISGYSKKELVGKNPRILNSGRQHPDVYRNMWIELAHKGHWQGEVWNRNKSGEVYAISLTISALYDKSNPPRVRNYLSLSADITRLKNSESKLKKLAHYDTLTGLPNRLLVTELLHQIMSDVEKNNKYLAVVFLDLDGFKEINETHGHDTGDTFLLELTLRLQTVIGHQGVLSRTGGDEFAIIIHPIMSPLDSEFIINEILKCVSDKTLIGGEVLKVTASMGVTFYPSDPVDAEQLLRHADQAMYQAKQEGKNCYTFFDPGEQKAKQSLSAMVKDVKNGIDRNEFTIFYQPKIKTLDLNVVGAEALIRWNHPEKGLLFPGQFLPQIEQQPVMIELGWWVLESALKQLDSWLKQGIDCPISVNLNSTHLQEFEFLNHLETLLRRFPDVKADRLEIEVLETTAVEDMITVTKSLQGIRDLGVLVAIDDFGTGYSSLSYLKHLPVNTLKIDQSFVRDLLVDEDDLAIVLGVISMAKAFKLNVIAEGVETEQHAIKLYDLGCEQVQGYGISHPLCESDFLDWYKSWIKKPSWKR